MKILGLFLAGFLSLSAKADVFQCNFTEPFIIVSLDTVKLTATWSAPGEEDVAVPVPGLTISEENILGATFDVDGVRHQLQIDFKVKGSDGMSDFIYPWAGKLLDHGKDSSGTPYDLFGGCFSENNKPVCPPNGGC